MVHIISPPGEITQPAELSTAGGLVEGRFLTASTYAANLWDQARQLLAELGSPDIGLFPITWDPVDLEPVDDGGLSGIAPTEAPPLSLVPPEWTDVPFTATVPDPAEVTLPIRTPPTPELSDFGFDIPGPPDVAFPTYTLTPPDVSDPDIPAAPTVSVPPVPQLDDIVIPSPPEYSIPDFEWELPTEDLIPPDPQFTWNEVEYDSELLQALKNKLLSRLISEETGITEYTSQVKDALVDKLYAEILQWTTFPEYSSDVKDRLAYNILRDLINGFLKGSYDSDINQKLAEKLYEELVTGGTGLNDETEQAIYDRAVSRQVDEEQITLDRTLEFFADRLYELPPGALNHQMLEMNNKILKTREDLNRDILIQQSNLAQINTHFVIKESIGRENYLNTDDIQYDRIQMEKTNFVVSAGIQNEGNLMNYDIAHVKNFIDYVQGLISAAVQNEKNLMDYHVQVNQLRLTHIEFIINASLQNEKNLMDYTNDFQNRALDAAKFTLQGALLIYQAKVEAYKARLEAYKALAGVYIARIQGEIAKAEFYKAQIEGAKATAEVQKARVDIYVAQVDAAKIWIELYKAEMEGVNARAQVDAVRIQGFIGQVQGYTAQVMAATERYKGYQAQIAGEAAKAEMYKAQAQAYSAMVEGYRTEIEADTLTLKQQIDLNNNKVDIFKAHIQKYAADIQAAVSQIDSETKIEELKVDEFKALVQNYSVELDAAVKAYTARVDHAKASADIEIKEADLIVREALGQYELLIKSITAAAQVASQMAASAISGVSASANIQHGESRSDSASFNASNSYMGQEVITDNFTNQWIFYCDRSDSCTAS